MSAAAATSAAPDFVSPFLGWRTWDVAEGIDAGVLHSVVHRVAWPHGQALEAAVTLAHELARFPQRSLRSDRLSAYEQWSLSYEDGWRNELRRGRDVIKSGETAAGAESFARGKGRHGAF